MHNVRLKLNCSVHTLYPFLYKPVKVYIPVLQPAVAALWQVNVHAVGCVCVGSALGVVGLV